MDSLSHPAEPQRELAALIAQFTNGDGMHDTAVPGLRLLRASHTAANLPVIYEPRICIVAQGRKQATLDTRTFVYDPLNYLVIAVTMPVVASILEASPEEPYLCAVIRVDPEQISTLVAESIHEEQREPSVDCGLFSARAESTMVSAVLRLVRLLQSPADINALAPLYTREIWYRVLAGDLGHRMRKLCQLGSNTQRIARAIDQLQREYTQPLRIEDLATRVHMSASALHHHFKKATSMSPLQFQKKLRLHEARRLMFNDGKDANAAAHEVGYESPSQFSREYRRLFGAPPKQDVSRLRTSA